MEWFKHDSNANLDEKLQEILLDYGLEGYGLYWYCVELIVGKVSADNITFELKHDARIIARNTGSTTQKVEEMMRRFVEVGLFESSDGVITCMKVAKRLASSATSNIKMRNLIQNIKLNQQDNLPSRHRHDAVMQDKNRIDEIRLEKTENITPEFNINITEYIGDGSSSLEIKKYSVETEFDVFWSYYPKKVGKEAARKSWEKMKPVLNQVLNALYWQKESDQWAKSNGQFIPNPATYLNQGRWQDEKPVEVTF